MNLQGSENPILIVLAGGKSSRMGTPKGLLPYKNTYWILEQISRYKQKGFVYIGLGFDFHLYLKVIPWLEKAVEKPQEFQGKTVRVVINKHPELGKFSTLQSVLKQVKQHQDTLVLPIDVPLLKPSALDKIIVVKNRVVLPNYNNKNGHPVKLSYTFWKTFLDLNPLNAESRLDCQIKQRATSEISTAEVEDDAILKNLNTPESWEAFVKP